MKETGRHTSRSHERLSILWMGFIYCQPTDWTARLSGSVRLMRKTDEHFLSMVCKLDWTVGRYSSTTLDTYCREIGMVGVLHVLFSSLCHSSAPIGGLFYLSFVLLRTLTLPRQLFKNQQVIYAGYPNNITAYYACQYDIQSTD